MSQKWYDIKAKAASDTQAASAEIYIYSEIGESWWGESVSAKGFIESVNALDAEQITVRINSYGGSVTDGIAIHNAIKRHKAKVTVAIDGVAMSIASLIAMAGDEVEMAENALLMIHAPWTWADGNAVQLREIADNLDTWAAAMANSYASKTGKTYDECLALLTDGKDHYFTAQEAQSAGYVDTITTALAVAASADKARSRLQAFFSAQAPIHPPAASCTGLPGTLIEEDHAPAEATPPAASATLANHVAAAVKAAGLEAHLSAFLLDPGVTDATSAQAAINKAREVSDLCDRLGMAEHSAALIQARADFATARATLQDAWAAQAAAAIKNQLPAGQQADPCPTASAKQAKAAWSKVTDEMKNAQKRNSPNRQTKE